MNATRIMASIALTVGTAIVLAGCAPQQSPTIDGSQVTVAVTSAYTSGNPTTSYGSTETNASIAYATGSGFTYFSDDSELIRDESFGHYEKLSDDPLTVVYTVSDGVRWSDGTAVDAVDLLLEWAATSGALNSANADPADTIDQVTGAPLDRSDTRVLFDAEPSKNPGMVLVTKTPRLSSDRMSLTLVFDEPFAGWESAFFGSTSGAKPAHVVGMMTFGGDDAIIAKERVLAAITADNDTDLSRIARTWNTVFNFQGMPTNADLVVANGPYIVSDLVAEQYVTLRANENYRGNRQPTFQEVTVRFMSDPFAQAQALLVGAVQIALPEMTAEVRNALATMDVTVVGGNIDSFEHLDLQFAQSKNGTFDDQLVRAAFLKTVPRYELVAEVLHDTYPRSTVRDSFLFAPDDPGYSSTRKGNGSAAYSSVDIVGAKELLVEAGVTAPPVCILYAAGDPQRMTEYALIKESAKAAGFIVSDCSVEDWQSALGVPGGYDAALFSWQSARPGAGVFPDVFASDGDANHNFFSDPAMDTLIGGANSMTADAQTLTAMLADADAMLFTNSYGLPLFQYPTSVAFDQNRVNNVSISALSPGAWWNVWQWHP
ncbi:MAG: ABC transporter family substrate-binding protein [Rhodoglobus sp.]